MQGNAIHYAVEPELGPEEWRSVLQRSTLAERRPNFDDETLRRLIAQSDVLVTARHGDELVGVSRAITDFTYCTYLSDLAVDVAWQRQGIGKELIRHTHAAAGTDTMLILLAAPAARTYYPHIGMEAHPSCWLIPRRG